MTAYPVKIIKLCQRHDVDLEIIAHDATRKSSRQAVRK